MGKARPTCTPARTVAKSPNGKAWSTPSRKSGIHYLERSVPTPICPPNPLPGRTALSSIEAMGPTAEYPLRITAIAGRLPLKHDAELGRGDRGSEDDGVRRLAHDGDATMVVVSRPSRSESNVPARCRSSSKSDHALDPRGLGERTLRGGRRR